jgi:hypothetical protein
MAIDKVRRRILEWTLWLSIAAFLGVISLAAASLFVPRSQAFFAVGEIGPGSRAYAVLRPGRIDMGSDLDKASDGPAPEIVNPRNISARRVRRSTSVQLPGFSLIFCLFHDGPAVWSLRMSLLLPLVLSGFVVVIAFYRLNLLQLRKPACEAAGPGIMEGLLAHRRADAKQNVSLPRSH